MAGLLVRPGHSRHRDEIGVMSQVTFNSDTTGASRSRLDPAHCQCGPGLYVASMINPARLAASHSARTSSTDGLGYLGGSGSSVRRHR